LKTLLTLIVFALVANSGVTARENPHRLWDDILQRHVVDGRVDYQRLKADQYKLDSYLAYLAKADVQTMSRQEKLAFWINAYNALTVKLILNHYPVKSIRDIKDPWDRRIWRVAEKFMSLNEIEHNELRSKLQEPRIHFAINCASISCPDLFNRAFSPANIETELESATQKFLRSSKHIKTESPKGLFGRRRILWVSQIFKWFKGDFTDEGRRGLTDFIMPYADEDTRVFIRQAGGKLKIRYLKYDWGLNEAQ
jgi:hypothetical protein